jgi:hypothetical protein
VNKAFIQFDIGVVPENDIYATTIGWMQSYKTTLAGNPPSVILQTTLDWIGKNYVNYKWDNGEKLFDYVQTSLKDRPNLILVDDTALIHWQGSLWSFMKEIAENPVISFSASTAPMS